MQQIEGFRLQKKIFESSDTAIYRAIDTTSQASVIIKTLSSGRPSLSKIAQINHEAKILQLLEGPEQPQASRLAIIANNPHLITSDFKGRSLDLVFASKQLEITEFLNLAIKITEQLREIHSKEVIHKDINPTNLILNEETQEVRIIDFGISTNLPRETTSYRPLEKLEGTLPYISPEQTGRMNQTIDYRSDYYSLGVCFYEFLCGRRPFESLDPMELIHCHIAKIPVPLKQLVPEVPECLAAIVDKLMAKIKGDRYQSASGLLSDLRFCLAELEQGKSNTPFVPGQADHSAIFQIPESLIGRESQVQQLLETYNDVAGGLSSLMLIAGFSGIGKTTLVNEIQKPITEGRGFYTSGKFNQYQRDIPYSALIEAFQNLVKQLLTQSEQQIEQWKTKFTEVLFPNAQVIIEVIPELELILGKQPEPAPIQAAESLNRFNIYFRRFVDVFAQFEHPLTVFLDDLQWADNGSLGLIQSLITDRNSSHMLLIGAYRDNEVNEAHPLMLTIANCEKQKASVKTIVLQELEHPHIEQLILAGLNLEASSAAQLSDVVMKKTGGNPFFAKEFLFYLYQKSLIEFDDAAGIWTADIELIQQQKSAENIVELITDKIQELPEPTKNLLKVAACLGTNFNLKTLALVSERPVGEILIDLWPALKLDLIVAEHDAYRYVSLAQEFESFSTIPEITFFFQHDRIQQASAQMLPGGEKEAVHLKIGRLLLADFGVEGEGILEVVNHLNSSRRLITDPKEMAQLGQLNFKAGLKTKKSTAYTSALLHFSLAIELIDPNLWQTDRETAFLMHKEQIECNYLIGEFDQAEQQVKALQSRVLNTPEQVNIHLLQTTYNTMVGRFGEAIELGQAGLRLFGIELNPTPSDEDFGAEMAQIQANMAGKSIAELVQLPPNQAPETLYPLIQLALMFAPTYITGNLPLMSLVILKMTAMATKHGDFNGVAFSSQGLLLGAQQNYQEGYEYTLVASKMSPQAVLPFFVMGAFVGPWKISFEECKDYLNTAYSNGLALGDLTYARYASQFIPSYSYIQGAALAQVLEANNKFFAFNEESGDPMGYAIFNLMPYVCSKLMEDPEPADTSAFAAQESMAESAPIIHAQYFAYQGQIEFIFGDPKSAYLSLVESEKTSSAVVGHGVLCIRVFYMGLAALALSENAQAEELEALKARISDCQAQMQLWADNSPDNFLHKQHLLAAEFERVAGNKDKAFTLYEAAIQQATKVQNLQDIALANELAAKCYESSGITSAAQMYLNTAIYWYQRWGASKKVTQLFELYPDFASMPKDSSRSHGSDTSASLRSGTFDEGVTTLKEGSLGRTFSSSSTQFSTQSFDLNSMIKTTRIINEHIELNALLSSMLELIIQNTGAQRGVLVVNEDNTLKIVAQLQTEKQTTELLNQPLDEFAQLCRPIVNLVSKSQKPVVVVDGMSDPQFGNDPYIQQTQQRSIMCCPMSVQKQLVGVIYLENSLVQGAFTQARAEFMRMFATQMGMSLNHAKLFAQVQENKEELTRKVAERTFELREANNTKDKFFSIIAHDLRGPVGSLAVLFNEILHKGTDLEDDLFEHVKVSTTRTHQLLEDLLTWAKSQQGTLEFHPSPFRISQSLEDIVGLLQTSANQKEIQITLDCPDDLSVWGDRSMISTVVRNLINNAIKFTPEQGLVEVTATQTDETVKVSVTDNGVGLQEDIKHRLFRLDEKVPSALGTKKEKGTGLGLILCREFVERHNGEIGVTSVLGEGSTFWFSLPVPDAAQQTTQHNCMDLSQFTALLVDDDPIELRATSQALQDLNVPHQSTTQSRDVLKLLEEQHFDFVLLDIDMPLMNGVQVTNAIRANLKDPPLVFALTSYKKAELDQSIGTASFDGFLSKPLEKNIFIACLFPLLQSK